MFLVREDCDALRGLKTAVELPDDMEKWFEVD